MKVDIIPNQALTPFESNITDAYVKYDGSLTLMVGALRRPAEEIKEVIAHARAKGWTPTESQTTERSEITMGRGKALPKETIDKIRELRREGMSSYQIAALLNMPQTTVSRHTKRIDTEQQPEMLERDKHNDAAEPVSQKEYVVPAIEPDEISINAIAELMMEMCKKTGDSIGMSAPKVTTLEVNDIDNVKTAAIEVSSGRIYAEIELTIRYQ